MIENAYASTDLSYASSPRNNSGSIYKGMPI